EASPTGGRTAFVASVHAHRVRGFQRVRRGFCSMSFINYAAHEITCKIVYYGPGLCGKTTNVQTLYERTVGGAKGRLGSLQADSGSRRIFPRWTWERWAGPGWGSRSTRRPDRSSTARAAS